MTERAWSHPGYGDVAELLGRRTGLEVRLLDTARFERAVDEAMRRANARELDGLVGLLERDPGLAEALAGSVTTKETYFFREPHQFEWIERVVLPDLLRRRGPEEPIRAWSAGCASGEEPYSLAVVLEEAGLGDRAFILGTDIARDVLARARDAVYGAWSLRGTGAARIRPYLRPARGRHRLDERIRRRVRFATMNLASGDAWAAMGTEAWDLVLCRNVLIYLEPGAIDRVGRRLFDALAPGGWLVTAPCDPPLAPFERVLTENGVAYRKPVALGAEGGPTFGHAVRKSRRPGSRHEDGGFGAGGAARRPTGREGARDAAADWAERVRRLARSDASAAERACREALDRHGTSVELAYLHATLLLILGAHDEAVRAAKRLIGAAATGDALAVAHFTLATASRLRGDRDGARRGYRTAERLARAHPEGRPLALAGGEPASRLAEAAARELALLGVGGEEP